MLDTCRFRSLHQNWSVGALVYRSGLPSGYGSFGSRDVGLVADNETLRHLLCARQGRLPGVAPMRRKAKGNRGVMIDHGPLARLPDGPPLLQVVVDTEEEFDWDRPFDRRNDGVTSVEAQKPAQALYASCRLRPTYVIDYPVARSASAADVLKSFQDSGHCQIGAHLHPWVNPPFDEVVGDYNSYPGNLPATLEAAKLRVLTDAIEAAFGRRPTMYKAGRYGVGPNTAAILGELGYRIDLSVVPHTDFRPQFGPDFRGWPDRPYWIADGMLEIPLSRGFSGLTARFGARLYRLTGQRWGRHLRLGGLLARTGLLERASLTPEGVTFDEIARLVRSMRRRGHRLFTLTYHSPSLAPGHTPYVRTARDVALFLDRIKRVLALFFEELGAQPTTPEEVFAMANRSATGS